MFLFTFYEHRAPGVPSAGPNRGDEGSVLVEIHHVRLVDLADNIITLKEFLLHFRPISVFLL